MCLYKQHPKPGVAFFCNIIIVFLKINTIFVA